MRDGWSDGVINGVWWVGFSIIVGCGLFCLFVIIDILFLLP